ncbi:fimbrial protein, partial [Campylobacter coli]|uniref:fimbrial protein n=2 Tax=Pseudomonadati TaxID=3379134 RepID=UPI003B97FFC1
ACSNEDDPIPNVDPTPTPETGTADLTIVVKNLAKNTQTKAADDSNAKEGETAIHNLFVALYNEDGTFLQV